MCKTPYEKKLEQRIRELEHEVESLKEKSFIHHKGTTVSVPKAMQPLFDLAEETVSNYFGQLKADPTQASIEIAGERYLMLRASSLSIDFFETIQQLYSDKNPEEAFHLGTNFLFDIAHVIGMKDAKAFHQKMGITEPIAKMSAGPIHFAYSGWAYVEIDPESQPSPGNEFFLKYKHPYSFEADSWVNAGRHADNPVCIMNAGYSSGWCEESYETPLTAVELTCRACGDDECTFIMAPPNEIEKHLKAYQQHLHHKEKPKYSVPTFFERKKVEEEMYKARVKAEESDQAKSEFLANMSHEMRTPLNAIRGYINLMQKDGVSSEHQDYLHTITQSSEHLLNIINDILDLSKIEAGELMLLEESCSLVEILKGSYATAERLLGILDKNIELKYQIDETISEFVLTDPTRLKQIIYNLLSNAIKFTQEGFIEFGVRLNEEKELLFYCLDSGIGVSKQEQASIFNMFGQVDASSTREFGGTGLGLTITQKLVQKMGGKIWLQSDLEQGSQFYFTQPYRVASAPFKTQEVKLKPLEKMGLHKSILLVEDNLINQKLTELVLKKAGFEVFKALNGQEAVDFYHSEKRKEIDLVLMDVQMPILDGLAATEIIRVFERANNICPVPIVALTAQAMQGDMEKCLLAGCNDYLTKPISIDSFIDVVVKTIAANKNSK